MRPLVSLLIIFSLLVTQFSFFIPQVLAASSPWSQTNWVGGSGQASWLDTTKYSTGTNVTTSVANQITLTATSGWCSNSYCNSSWGYRRKITFNNTDANLGVASEALTNFPVLVKLDSTRIDYTKTQSAGQDIRFTDSSGADLAYEIEKWDSTGTSWVWVKVPSIPINSSTGYIYMYYGNSSASDHQQTTSVWNTTYGGVWHLKEASGNANDSTVNANNGTPQSGITQSAAGKINSAYSFNGGTSAYINVPNNTTIDPTSTWTLSAWVNRSVINAQQAIIEKYNWSTGYGSYALRIADSNVLRAFVIDGTQYALCNGTTSLASNTWYYVSATFNFPTNTLKCYVNGLVEGTNSLVGLNPPVSSTFLKIGGRGDDATMNFNGVIDEARVSNVSRSAAWIAASYKSESDAFNTFAAPESAYSVGSGTLTSSIFDSGQGSNWGILTYAVTTPTNTSVSVKVRSGNLSDLSDATAFASCTAISSGSTVGGTSCAPNNTRYVQYQLNFSNTDSVSTPTFTSFSLAFVPIVVSVTVSTGTVSYGLVPLNTSKDTTATGLNNTQTVTNNGNTAEDFTVKGQNTACPWTLSATNGSNQYIHSFSTNSGSTWTGLTTSFQSLASNIAVNATQNVDFKITMPTSTSCYTQQSADVTIQAAAH